MRTLHREVFDGCGAAWRGIGLWGTLLPDAECADLAPSPIDDRAPRGLATAVDVASGAVCRRRRRAGHRCRVDPAAPLWWIEADLGTNFLSLEHYVTSREQQQHHREQS